MLFDLAKLDKYVREAKLPIDFFKRELMMLTEDSNGTKATPK